MSPGKSAGVYFNNCPTQTVKEDRALKFLSGCPRLVTSSRYRQYNQTIFAHMLNKHRKSLSETLKNLISSGYSLADAKIAALPDESIQSDDWRLDSVEQIRQEQGKALVIAVSSVQKCMKLIFVEVLLPQSDFSLMNLVRRLFPMRQRAGVSFVPVYSY